MEPGGVGRVARSVRGSKYTAPKTVLAFFAIVVGLLLSGAVTALAVLSGRPALHWLIIPILVFIAVTVAALLVFVCVAMWRRPEKLMLGEVSGSDYLAYEERRLTLGDSLTGVHLEERIGALPGEGMSSDAYDGGKSDR